MTHSLINNSLLIFRENMFRTLFIIVVSLSSIASTTKNCSSVISYKCNQRCSSTSCKCASDDIHYAECYQTCGNAQCKELTCTSGTCYQECHDCRMECTRDVGYCNQRCLSGACSFKCSAKVCVQKCGGKDCKHLPTEHEEPFIPRLYLVILAGLFAATTILTCLALMLSCSQIGCCKRKTPLLVSRDLSNSLGSLPTKPSVV